MKIALAQFNPTVGDFAGNSARILALSQKAKDQGADLAVFSELCLCGYPPQDLLERPAFIERNQKELKALAKALTIPSVVGFVGKVKNGTLKSIANKAALVCGGKVVFEQSKMLLPTYDVFDESRYFHPAEKQQVIEFHGVPLGLTICEDAWNDENFWPNKRYDRDPIVEIFEQGAKVLLNISASPYTIDKRALRVDMLRSIAVHNQKPVVYVNQFGGNDSLIFDGASVALTPDGRVAAQALAFEEDLVMFDTETGEGEIHEQPRQEIEYAFRALVTGTRDYVQKCGFKKVLVGLSGGIDSAVVASIAVEALGAENVLGVSMPGPFSSDGSKQDAGALAKNLGIEFMTIPVSEVFDAYRGALKPAFGRRKEDVTEENLQARIRGNYLMAISNKFGSMVLSTGNKSENAVGYCTLYGDMAGGLAVISDVPKLMVYELAKWINRERELVPCSTIDKPPSAELRPNQKDEDSLPPYDVLDRILKAYIEDLKSPQEIADKYDFDIRLVREIAALVDRNEYKRKQAAPGLKITSRAFGFGRPFPIAQKFIP
ncbi:MAG TPA: NAD+ synthase [Candidatus Acidoferrum sp.]|nr:NAD+ synthase [Candidatus Acidoferrum sp.]